MTKILLTEIEDKSVRDNFKKIDDQFRNDPFLKGNFRFFQYTFSDNARVTYPATVEIPHQLGFQPLDVIVLSVRKSDGETVTWHYDDFTRSHIRLTSTGPCSVRAYIGRYGES